MKKLLTMLLCAALVFGLLGCTQEPAGTTPPTTTAAPTPPPTETTAPPLTAAELYTQAADKVNEKESLELEIAISKATTVGGETFSESSEQTLLLRGLGTNSVSASLTEHADYITYTADITELYVDGTAYANVNEFQYTSELASEDYLSRFAPAVLLDAALYGTVEEGADGTITFSSPTALESWLAPEYAELIDASGTATLDADGSLTQSTYTASYTQVSAQVDITVTVSIAVPEDGSIVAPADAADYTQVESIDAPRLIEQGYGYLLQGQSISFTSLESILTQAAGAMRNQQTTINMHGAGLDQMARIDNSVYIMDYNTYQPSEYEQSEVFRDGKYTLAVDGGEPEEQSGVTVDIITEYCYNTISSCVPDLTYLSGATATDLGSTYLIEYTYSEYAGEVMQDSVSYTLFQNENLLDDLASTYTTTTCEGYMAIDKYTGLPTSLGINYAGSHTIEGGEYILTYQLDQSFNVASLDSYEAITEEPLPSDMPENTATPLFYHVTGPEGQEMWLLGTIHVGDIRTGYLPQEIYLAFNESDALAVEFDTEAFNDRAETDEDLQNLISDAYYYSDGTTIADHIEDTELYDYAVQLMKATGNYNFNAPYMRPSIWSQSIDNFFLRQGYSLTSDRGVDTQLIKLAQAQGKTILDIESGEFQIQMMTGYSEALQEELLGGSASTDAAEYIASVEDLYEKWCAGDEAVLKEALTDDLSGMTEEELALYEEYNKAMMTDRNAGMLEVAKEYLESGDVIFYAVGLAHLLSDDGLVFTLRDAGYTVELVAYGQAPAAEPIA